MQVDLSLADRQVIVKYGLLLLLLIDTVAQCRLLFIHGLRLRVDSIAVGRLESQAARQSFVGLHRMDTLARGTPTTVSVLRLSFKLEVFPLDFTTDRVLLHPIIAKCSRLSHTDLPRCSSLKISGKRIDSCAFSLGVSLVMIVRLLPLVVIKKGESSAVRHLGPREHDSLGTDTPLHPQLLVLLLDCLDYVAAKQHLHLGEAILEELLLRDLNLVREKVYLQKE